MAEGVKVTGFTVREKEMKNGNLRLGFFDCELPGMRLTGCSLVRTRQGGFVAFPPRLDGVGGHQQAIHVTDTSWRQAMMEGARAAYVALGGAHGEWTPRAEPGDDDRAGLQRVLGDALRKTGGADV